MAFARVKRATTIATARAADEEDRDVVYPIFWPTNPAQVTSADGLIEPGDPA
jgi:hypothetical protein